MLGKLTLLALAVFAILGAGCSGINTSQGVSPAMFLLPGLMQKTSPPAVEPSAVPQPSHISLQASVTGPSAVHAN